MRIAKWLLAAMMVNLVTVCLAIAAADPHAASPSAEHSMHATPAESAPCPKLSEDATWVRPMVAAIAALFITAIPVGLVIRANMPQQLPATHSHDEPPGSTSHDAHDSHGAGGHH